MSRFDDLRQVYAEARKRFFSQREASTAFASTIMQEMESYLQCPPFFLHFMPYTQAVTSSKTHSALAAVWLANDALWHFKVALDLRSDQEGLHHETAGQTVTFELIMEAKENGFSVGIKGWPERFEMTPVPGSAEHTAFYDFVCERIFEDYRRPGQRFFDNMADPQRPLGG
jgi:hypothetical protein